MKALVTGAGGFSASHLIALLERESIQVVGLDVREGSEKPRWGELRRVDVTDFEALSSTIHEVQPDYVFHLAGAAGGSFQDIHRTHVVGTITLLEAILASGVETGVLLVGSSAEYGPVEQPEEPVAETTPCWPASPYGLSKYLGTLASLNYARRHGMRVVIARPFNLVGAGIPGSLVVGALIARAKVALRGDGPPRVKVGNLRSRRDFVAVTDAVEAYLRMVRAGTWGEVINVCAGRSWSIGEVAELLFRQSPRLIELEVDPQLVRGSEVDVIFGCGEKAKRLLGWEFRTSLEEALRDAWDSAMEERKS